MKSPITVGEFWWLLFTTLVGFIHTNYTWQGALSGFTVGLGLMLFSRY